MKLLINTKNSNYQDESGFTLIEILVVILIIGILASIAVPVFLNQRKVAMDSTVQSDVRNTAMAIQTYLTDHPNEEFAPVIEIRKMVTKSSPTTIIRIMGDQKEYCVNGFNPNGKKYVSESWDHTAGDKMPYAVYSSAEGGLDSFTEPISLRYCYPPSTVGRSKILSTR